MAIARTRRPKGRRVYFGGVCVGSNEVARDVGTASLVDGRGALGGEDCPKDESSGQTRKTTSTYRRRAGRAASFLWSRSGLLLEFVPAPPLDGPGICVARAQNYTKVGGLGRTPIPMGPPRRGAAKPLLRKWNAGDAMQPKDGAGVQITARGAAFPQFRETSAFHGRHADRSRSSESRNMNCIAGLNRIAGTLDRFASHGSQPSVTL